MDMEMALAMVDTNDRLHRAVVNGGIREVIRIMEGEPHLGESVMEWVDQQGNTPLQTAINKGCDLLARLLIYGGANFTTVRLPEPGSEAAIACKLAIDLIKTKLGAPVVVAPLHDALLPNAAFAGDVESLLVLALYGVDIDVVANCGDTALCLAATMGHTKAVETLIHAGADLNKQGIDGQTPLFVAALSGCRDVVSVLLKAGALKDKCDNSGATPLCAAMAEGNIDIATILVGAGASVNNSVGTTPLWYAVRDGNYNAVSMLLAAGANPNCSNADSSCNALTMAIGMLDIRIARALLNAGADVTRVRIYPDMTVEFNLESLEMLELITCINNGADVASEIDPDFIQRALSHELEPGEEVMMEELLRWLPGIKQALVNSAH